MAGGLTKIKGNVNAFILLADSKSPIVAVRNAGKTGKARSRHLQEVANMMSEVEERGREVSIGWVKSHIGILGNEAADAVAKKATEGCLWMTTRSGRSGEFGGR